VWYVKRKDSVGSHAHTDAVGEGAEGVRDAVHDRGPHREGEHDSLRRERRSGLCLATTEGRGGSSLQQPTKTGGARSGDGGEPDHGVLTETRHRVQVWHITIYPLRGSTAWIQGDNNLGPGKEHMVDLFVFCWRGGVNSGRHPYFDRGPRHTHLPKDEENPKRFENDDPF